MGSKTGIPVKRDLVKYFEHQKFRFYAGIFAFLVVFSPETHVFAQSPGPQDCLGAIPICGTSYTNNTIYTGVGAIPNEINALTSCLLTGERNDAWYIFTTSSAGNLAFSIVPNNIGENYDWALYNISNASCSDIFSDPTLELSCNYSNITGVTGANGLAGVQNNPMIPVAAGQTFVLNVSSFSAVNQSGYTIDLSASTASLTDNTPPVIANVTSLNCGASSISVVFNEKVLCNTVQPGDFTLTGPGGPYTITGVSSPSCTQGATASKNYILTLSPAIIQTGAFTFTMTGTVDDQCGNTTTGVQSFPIQINSFNVSLQKNDVTCFGGNNGSATATVSGAAGPFTYQWSPSGGNSASAQFLVAGTYTVTVTSQAGCVSQASVTINQPLTGMSATVTTTPANGCAANGSAAVTVQNGQPPYSYSWWPSGGNTPNASGLSAGGYMVTITDANQCVLNYFLNVPSVNGPSASIISSTDVNCHGGNNGSATVAVTGASGPFTYSWSPSGGTGATANNLSAGMYTVAVTINAGCTVTASVVISEPPTALSANPTIVNTSCGGQNGSVQLNTSGGVPGYAYQWSPSVSTSAFASSLSGGAYTVTITDANGCTLIKNIQVANSSKPIVTLAGTTDITCNGLNNGSIDINISGGVQPYSYSWSSGQTTQNISSLAPGVYSVTVTDANGCTGTVSTTIIQPPALVLQNVSVTNVLCKGDNTGEVVMNVSGGTGQITWQWQGNISIGPTASNLSAGTYSVTVTDQNSCTQSTQISVTEPQQVLSSSATVVQPTCGLQNGSITLNVSGGTGPYNYNWTPSVSVGSGAQNLSAGVYGIVITDANGCTFSITEQLQSANAPAITLQQITHVLCNGGSNGSVAVNVSGGQPPYSYLWSDGSSGSGLLNASAGVYTLTVTDQAGCQSSYQTTINEPLLLQVSIPGPFTICQGGSVQITLNASGGTAPYTYQWSDGSIGSSISAAPVNTTSYVVTITDANGCIATSSSSSVSVRPPLALSISAPDSVCSGTEITVNANASGGDGNYSIQWSNGMTGSSNTITIVQSTSLSFTLSDGCNSPQAIGSVSIVAVDPPSVSFNMNPLAGCEPLEVSFTINGGVVPGLNYNWDFGDGTNSTVAEPQHLYWTEGSFLPSLTITSNAAGSCAGTAVAGQPITVYPKPKAAFTYDPSDPTRNFPTVYFKDISNGAVNRVWDFGDNAFASNVTDPVHTYQDTGLYIVKLMVTSIDGCTDSVMQAVKVRDDIMIYIPNAFTPENNGVNDKFKIYGVGIEEYEIVIFDRWGKVVHKTSNTDVAWDGIDMNTGKPSPQGIYIYKAVIKDQVGDTHTRVDRVTLLR